MGVKSIPLIHFFFMPVLFIYWELNFPNSGKSIPKSMYHYHYHYNYNINRELNFPNSGHSITNKHNHDFLNLK